MMFRDEQFDLANNFENKEEFRRMKYHFHVVLRKNEDVVWSSVKIVRVLNVSKDVLFKGMSQNYRFFVVRENNVVFDFSVAEFPLMNLYDLLIVVKILKSVDYSKLQTVNKEYFIIGFKHLEVFIDGYYGALAETDIDMATTLGNKVSIPKSFIRDQSFLKNYEDGEISLKPMGIVFFGKNKKSIVTKFLFQMNDIEKYTSSHYTNLLIRMERCAKNSDKEKVEIKKMVNWY